MTRNDQYWMARALRLAERGLYTAHPNPRVGCVLVREGERVAEGWHERTGSDHAEAAALKVAGKSARGCTAYVTLEPCCHQGRTPPCAQALVAAGVTRVVVGAPDPNPRVDGGGIAVLRAAGIEVTEGVLERECAALNVGFNQRMIRGRPWLRVKLAISLDGRTALIDGTSQWISGDASRADVQRWRARSSAILTGIGTVLGDDPSLNVRDPALENGLQPQRIIVDSALRTPVDAKLLGLPGQVRIFSIDASADARMALESTGAVVENLPGVDGRVDLHALLRRLGELEINELTAEAGPALCGALLSQELVDELLVYQAAHVLGSEGRGMFDMPALTRMQDRPQFELVDTRRTGDDLRLIYRRNS